MASETFTCEWPGCSAVAATQGQLNKHKNTHLKPFKCETCQRSFALRTVLQRHIRSIHRAGQQQHRCHFLECDFSTARKDNLGRHIRKTGHQSSAKEQKSVVTEEENEDPSIPDSALADVDKDIVGVFNSSILLKSATSGNIELMGTCLQAGVSIESRADDGSTPLHCAARAGQVDAMTFLIQEGAEVTTWNILGMTPVSQAIRSRNLDALKVFFDDKVCGRLFDTDASTLDYVLARYGTIDMFHAYLNSLGDYHDSIFTSTFFSAIRYGNVSLSIALSNHPLIDVNKANRLGYLPAHFAARYNRIEIMRHLIKFPCIDLVSVASTQGLAVLHFAARQGHLEIVKLLLNQDTSLIRKPANGNRMPYHFASMMGRTKVVAYLHSVPGIDIHCKDLYGHTALVLAALQGKWETVHLILEHQEVCSLQGSSTSLLSTGEPFVKTEAVRKLLKHIDFKDPNIKTPNSSDSKSLLESAAENGDCDLIEVLLENKDVDVNISSHWRGTPLHQAIESGHIGAVKLLLQHPKIELGVRNRWGETPLGTAKRENRADIIDFLLLHGAKDEGSIAPSIIVQPTTASDAANTVTPQITPPQSNNKLYADSWSGPIYGDLVEDWDVSVDTEDEMSE